VCVCVFVCECVCVCPRAFVYVRLHQIKHSLSSCTPGWRRRIKSPKLQIIFHKRATKYRSLLRKMTCKDKGSYQSSPPCTLYLAPNICKTGFCVYLSICLSVYLSVRSKILIFTGHFSQKWRILVALVWKIICLERTLQNRCFCLSIYLSICLSVCLCMCVCARGCLFTCVSTTNETMGWLRLVGSLKL